MNDAAFYQGFWPVVNVVAGAGLAYVGAWLQERRISTRERDKARRAVLLERLSKAYNPGLEIARRPFEFRVTRDSDGNVARVEIPYSEELDRYVREVRPVIYANAHLFSAPIVDAAQRLDQALPKTFFEASETKSEGPLRGAMAPLYELYGMIHEDHRSLSEQYQSERQ